MERNMNMIDNAGGFAVNLGVSGLSETTEAIALVKDSFIYGESAIPDCP
jgi:hypothetical protein